MKQVIDDMATLAFGVRKLETSVNTLSARVDSLETRTGTLEERSGLVEKDLESVHETVKRNEGQIEKIHRTLAAVNSWKLNLAGIVFGVALVLLLIGKLL